MKKILIVEDDTVTRTILKTVLASEFEVFEALSGEEALAMVDGIDLIICDYHMSNMSGLELAQKIRDKNIPFFMLTVENSPEEKEKSKNYGVNGWLTKPFAPNFLLNRIRKILGEPGENDR